jgi:hypothetical protein
MRSLILLTSCYPTKLGLRRLVVLDYLLVHTGDLARLDIATPPSSIHPAVDSRAVELLVRRGLVSSGLSLMGTRRLINRYPTSEGFRYEAGEEAGTFIDYLRSGYAADLKVRAQWLSDNIVPLSDEELDELVRDHLDHWAAEFQADNVGSV